MGFLMGVLYFGLDALAIVLLIAIWQRSRMSGFLLLAVSYGVGLLFRPAMPLLVSMMGDVDASSYHAIGLISQGVFVGTSVIALAGFWNIYSGFRNRTAPAPQAPPA
jgi:hypothetical protein